MKGLIIYTPDELDQSNLRIKRFTDRMESVDLNEDASVIESKIEETEPDYIITAFSDKLLDMKPLGNFGAKVIIGTGDPWGRLFSEKYKKLFKYVKGDAVHVDCHCLVPAYEEYFKGMDVDVFLYKWSLDLDVLKDYKEEKIWDVMYSGKFSTYQFRRELDYILSTRAGINYKRFRPYNVTKIPYDEYARNINRSWIGIGGCLQSEDKLYYKGHDIGVTFPKTVEIPACATALINPYWVDAEILGFKDGENCILFKDLREAIKKIKYYLRHKDELIDITKAGYELVRENFDVADSTNNFIKEIEKKYG